MLLVCVFASAVGALVMCLLVLRDGFPPISTDPARADRDLLITRLGHAVAGACFATTAILAMVLVARTPAPTRLVAADPQVMERLTVLDRERQAVGEQVNALGATVQALREQVGSIGSGLEGMRTRLDESETRAARADAGLAGAQAAAANAEAGIKGLRDEFAQASARARQVEANVTKPAAAPARETIVPPGPRETVVPATPRAPLRRVPAGREDSAESASPTTGGAIAPARISPPPARGSVDTVSPPSSRDSVSTAPRKPSPGGTAARKPAPVPAPMTPQELPETSLADKLRRDWTVIRRGFSTAGDEITAAMRQLSRRLTGGD